MKGSEIKRKLIKAGWYCVRNGARHDLYGHKDRPGVLIPIPRHEAKEVPKGTANNILKAAEII